MAMTFEWAQFSLRPGVTEPQLRQASALMQKEFLDRQGGFVQRDTVRLAPGRYADLVVWQSPQAAKAAIAAATADPVCRAYFGLMTVDSPPETGLSIDRHGKSATWAGLEFSRFRLRDGVDPSELDVATREMAQGVYAGKPGFISHSVFRSGEGEYADVLLADTGARAEALCGSWVEDREAGTCAPACRHYLSLIEPSSIRLEFWDRVTPTNT